LRRQLVQLPEFASFAKDKETDCMASPKDKDNEDNPAIQFISSIFSKVKERAEKIQIAKKTSSQNVKQPNNEQKKIYAEVQTLGVCRSRFEQFDQTRKQAHKKEEENVKRQVNMIKEVIELSFNIQRPDKKWFHLMFYHFK
jgi:hypothetical protein